MAATVRTLTRTSDIDRIRTAAKSIRTADCVDAADLADLLEAVADAMDTRDQPPLGDVEMWRWSATVCVARRIGRNWLP